MHTRQHIHVKRLSEEMQSYCMKWTNQHQYFLMPAEAFHNILLLHDSPSLVTFNVQRAE